MGFFKKLGKIVTSPVKMADSMLFGRKPQNPYGSAMPYLGQAESAGRGLYQPYVNQGQDAYTKLNPLYSEMMQDPTAYMKKLMGGYETSPDYDFKSQQMQKAMQNAAASGGFAGTDYDQMQRADTIRGLLGQDMQQYFNNVRNIQDAGLGGQQSFYDTGFNASRGLSDYLSDVYASMANAQAASSQFQNQARQDRRGARMKFLGSLIGMAASGFNPASIAGGLGAIGMGDVSGSDLSNLFSRGKNFFQTGSFDLPAPEAPSYGRAPVRAASPMRPQAPRISGGWSPPLLPPAVTQQPRIPYR